MLVTDKSTDPALRQAGGVVAGSKPESNWNVRLLRRWWLVLASLVTIAYLVLGLGVPLFYTVQSSVEYGPFWGAYTDQLSSSSNLIILGRTILLGVGSTAITAVIGYPVAYAMTLIGPRFRAVILVMMVFPQLTSFLVRSYAWIGLLGVNGPIVAFLHWLGIDATTFNSTDFGVVVVLLHGYLPIMILTCYVSMARIDPSHLRAARTLGANHLESFWRVYAPQTWAGVVCGAALVFIGTVGMYVTPALIGGPSYTTIVTVVVQQVTQGIFGVPAAYPAALAVILTGVVALVLTLTSRLVGVGEILGIKTAGVAHRPSHPSRHRSRQPLRVLWGAVRRIPGASHSHHILVGAMVVLAVLLIDAPFVYLIGMSFQPLPLLSFPTGEWSTRWYTAVFMDPTWGAAALQSAQIAVLATLVALVVGTFLALRTTSVRRFTGAVIVATALLPMVVPAVMYAAGIYSLFTEAGFIGNWVAIALVHSILGMPYVYVNVLNGLRSYDPRWDQAASSLGASPWRRLRTVTLPLLRPAVISGAFLAALTSLDEFTTTLFMGGITFENMPLKFWSSAQQNLSPELAVVGVLLTGATLAIAALAAAGFHGTRVATKTNRNAS